MRKKRGVWMETGEEREMKGVGRREVMERRRKASRKRGRRKKGDRNAQEREEGGEMREGGMRSTERDRRTREGGRMVMGIK